MRLKDNEENMVPDFYPDLLHPSLIGGGGNQMAAL
jgi:hypothetical protein